MPARPRWWSADRDGDAATGALLSAPRAGRTAAAAGGARGSFGLAARKSVLDAGQRGADHRLRRIDRLGGAAGGAVFPHRRGVVRERSDRVPRRAGAAGARRMLAVRADVAVVFRLWLLSGRPALAGRSVLCGAGLRHRLAAAAVRAAPRHRCAVRLRRAAGAVVRACCTARRGWGSRWCRPRCGAAFS